MNQTIADDPAARSIMQQMAAINPMFQWLDIRIVRAGIETSCFEMTIAKQHSNTFGIGHGGIVFAFADLAFGFTCNARGEKAVTASAAIDFLRPVPLGETLVADVALTELSGRNGFYDVRLYLRSDEATAVGLVRGRMRILGGPVLD